MRIGIECIRRVNDRGRGTRLLPSAMREREECRAIKKERMSKREKERRKTEKGQEWRTRWREKERDRKRKAEKLRQREHIELPLASSHPPSPLVPSVVLAEEDQYEPRGVAVTPRRTAPA